MKITHISLTFALAFTGFVIGCSSSDKEVTEVDNGPDNTIAAIDAFPALTFSSPVEIKAPADSSNRIFVVEQAGVIKVFDNNSAVSSSTTFLDIKSKVNSGGELGLLGLAFHPNFKTNGYFYVNYTKSNPLQTVIARYKVNSASGNSADASNETILLTYNQPYTNHKGGSLQFGKDGYLYISAGDGGSAGDPLNNAQNKKTFLGKILRIDVNATTKGNYGIPADNPFVGNTEGFFEEIYAYGLRNPWKTSFDMGSDRFFAADVGQGNKEEINLITKGGNYGWKIKEGKDCYSPSSNCDATGLTEPVLDYGRADGDISITGGYVYRGSTIASLAGKYIYGDYASGRIWALELDGNTAKTNSLLMKISGTISTFGQDTRGEVYFANYASGKIMKLGVQ
ncbi:PQQ-dependent sugar dehydrogenase [Dyadobacter subterraneus]|uniref:PQQ-dependent sugar dehydrogenase n=1 Tax=Dyadobacter subterraneus TaxID=2773304 RepID=A0ABR9W4X1_9BACT|nr:PQQ-dependent sugar dehydrogenase [Dyadobacter subterraneus]MBE9460473.1 PQQ-dependent sugar dehydrogenase [Dyadobacter subterraneus]